MKQVLQKEKVEVWSLMKKESILTTTMQMCVVMHKTDRLD